MTIILSDDPERPEYRLHKMILAVHSSFFRHLFYDEPKEVYEIRAVSKKTFDGFISCIYGGKLGNKDAYTDVTIILSDDPERPKYSLHKMILSQDKTFCHLFEHEPKEVYEIGASLCSGIAFGPVFSDPLF